MNSASCPARVLLFITPILLLATPLSAQSIKLHQVSGSVIIQGDSNTVLLPRGTLADGTVSVEAFIQVAQQVIPDGDTPETEAEPIQYTEGTRSNGVRVFVPETGYIFQYLLHRHVELLDVADRLPDPPILPPMIPDLEVRVVNNSNATVTISSIVLDVERSQPVSEPLGVFSTGSDDLFALTISDEGSVRCHTASLEFGLFPEADEAVEALSTDKPLRWRANATFQDRIARLSIREQLRSEGVDVEKLEKLAAGKSPMIANHKEFLSAVHRFRFSAMAEDSDGNRRQLDLADQEDRVEWQGQSLAAVTAGRIRIVGDTAKFQNSGPVEFLLAVPLSPAAGGTGAGFDVTGLKKAVFRKDSESYRINIPVSAITKPGDGDRFIIRLVAPVLSWHTFTPHVVLGGTAKTSGSAMKVLIHK